MKKNVLIFFLLIFSFKGVLATYEDCETIGDNFEKYECRVEKICEPYEENKKIFIPEKYKKIGEYEDSYSLADSSIVIASGIEDKKVKKVISIYKENMNSIYKCAILSVQKNSVINIKDELLQLDKTGDIKKSFEPKINELVEKIDELLEENDCLNIDKETIYNKLSILKQTTYVTCDYTFYLEYLKTHYNNPTNALGITDEELEGYGEYSIQETVKKVQTMQNGFDIEVEQAYKTFKNAYHAYSEYENNFPIHFMMQLLKEDYYIFRDKLHQVLNPINQVVYKISNAMK